MEIMQVIDGIFRLIGGIVVFIAGIWLLDKIFLKRVFKLMEEMDKEDTSNGKKGEKNENQ